MIASARLQDVEMRSRAAVMSSDGSITHWLGRLQAGDPAAAQPLWERYFHRLIGLARHRLRNARRLVADEEDVALSAFDSFCRHAERGRFPGLLDRESLWRLLVVVTARKAANLVRDEGRQKRGGPTPADDPAELGPWDSRRTRRRKKCPKTCSRRVRRSVTPAQLLPTPAPPPLPIPRLAIEHAP
jgi:DNA-directed RNA polymerase specialized sigma24 family protein